DAEKNTLDTGTLGFSDISNEADYKTAHQGIGVSSGASMGGQFAGNMANTLLAGAGGSGHAEGTTQSAVSAGTIVVRDGASQQQDVTTLSRDAAGANDSISPIFNKEKEQQRLQMAQLIGEVGAQAGDIARTEGQIRATNAGKAELAAKGIKEPGENATKEDWANYNKALTETSGYKTAQQQWGTGSAIQQGIQAATAAVQGLAGGDLKAALAGASAPYIAEVIKQYAPDETSRVMAHAAVAGVIAAAQGNSAAAGAAGAATTAAMGEAIKNALYGDVPVSQLSEEQKQTLVALGSLAAGLAGGLAGDGTADVVAGAQAGQNEISNNMTSLGMLQMMQAKSLLDAAAVAEAGQGGANEQAALALTKAVKKGLDAACLANTSCVVIAIAKAQNQQHADGTGSKTETVPVNDDLTGGKLVNPVQDESKGTSLITPDQSGDQGASNTGNTDGAPGTGGNTTVTPIPEQNKDDLAYSSETQLGRGSTGRTEANSLQEKLAIEQALSNPEAGRQLPIPMTDKRWPREDGWVKMAQNINGVEIHYVRNTNTGQVDDFKFK
ncbi:VENN motif pre-toxin domain-containing protein, partial [Erwinia mallotivora]